MIIGAGFAGLIAAAVFPRMPIVEAAPEPTEGHRALLRFRSTAVAELTGVDFRAVTVRKGIWMDGGFVPPSILAANRYSQKVLGGRLVDRSIWDTESVTRYIAPETFYEQLTAGAARRISYGTPFPFSGQSRSDPVISTAPMPVVLNALGIDGGLSFDRSPVRVRRFRVTDADVHQTVYFPTPAHGLYRASITGDLLICEFTFDSDRDLGNWDHDLYSAFGISFPDLRELDAVEQRYGKIAPVADGPRRALIHRLSDEYGIYSLGRFGTWRNILLDDVVQDARVIRRLMSGSDYDRRLAQR